MLIFNTTFLVTDAQYDSWIKWVKETQIPFVLQSGMFTKAQLAKVYSQEDQDGSSYSLQFQVANLETLENWHLQYAQTFEENFAKKFGTEVVFFASILEIIE